MVSMTFVTSKFVETKDLSLIPATTSLFKCNERVYTYAKFYMLTAGAQVIIAIKDAQNRVINQFSFSIPSPSSKGFTRWDWYSVYAWFDGLPCGGNLSAHVYFDGVVQLTRGFNIDKAGGTTPPPAPAPAPKPAPAPTKKKYLVKITAPTKIISSIYEIGGIEKEISKWLSKAGYSLILFRSTGKALEIGVQENGSWDILEVILIILAIITLVLGYVWVAAGIAAFVVVSNMVTGAKVLSMNITYQKVVEAINDLIKRKKEKGENTSQEEGALKKLAEDFGKENKTGDDNTGLFGGVSMIALAALAFFALSDKKR